jgi:hypothetical protein
LSRRSDVISRNPFVLGDIANAAGYHLSVIENIQIVVGAIAL